MPDYNKGDFTQQGIDGFVEGGLHLNEKRCLTARISTDEEAEGLDSVEINIHDHLNDLDYTFSGENIIAGTSVIGQAPSGNIEITENGENINVAPYATATVNVSGGGGDDNIILPMTEVTWDGTGVGRPLLIDPDTSKVPIDNKVIIRLNDIGEETIEYVLLGTYNPNAGPTLERFRGTTEGDPLVKITISHNKETPTDPWYFAVVVVDEAMPGTYLVGVCTDIPTGEVPQ